MCVINNPSHSHCKLKWRSGAAFYPKTVCQSLAWGWTVWYYQTRVCHSQVCFTSVMHIVCKVKQWENVITGELRMDENVELGLADAISSTFFERKRWKNHDVYWWPHVTLKRLTASQTHSHGCFTARLQARFCWAIKATSICDLYFIHRAAKSHSLWTFLVFLAFAGL